MNKSNDELEEEKFEEKIQEEAEKKDGEESENQPSNQEKISKEGFSIVLIDDEFEVFKNLKVILDKQKKFSIVGQAASFRIARTMLQTYKPDLAILNTQMSNIREEEYPWIVRKIKEQTEEVKVIAVVDPKDSGQIFRILKAGAFGCISVNEIKESLLDDFGSVLSGGVFIPPNIAASFLDLLRELYGQKPSDENIAENITKELTIREMQLLILMIKGFTYEKISETCKIKVSTVKTHFNAIFTKLGVKNRFEASSRCLRLDLQILIKNELEKMDHEFCQKLKSIA